MTHTRTLISVIMILLVSATVGWSAGSFKCGPRIVRTGDTTLDVLNACGEPTFREHVGTEYGGLYAREQRESEEGTGRDVTRGRYSEFSVDVERWYYDCGRNKLIRILTFKGGILRDIEVGRDYGVGASDCIGPASGVSGADQKEEYTEPHGTVSILGRPYGARIYLDQEYVADVPATLERIEPGAYNLTVRKRGYEDWVKRIVVEPDETVYVNVYMDPVQKEAEESSPNEEEIPLEEPSKIYKWTDEEGNIHITDKPPPTYE